MLTDDNVHTCAICGVTAPMFTLQLDGDPSTGTPAGWVCEDDAERLDTLELVNLRRFALTAADRARAAGALRAVHGGAELDRIAAQLAQPPVQLNDVGTY